MNGKGFFLVKDPTTSELYASRAGDFREDKNGFLVTNDGYRVQLQVEGLRELFVHELVAAGIRSKSGEPLLHPYAYYTLNRIP